jgi:hypothetical protein
MLYERSLQVRYGSLVIIRTVYETLLTIKTS